MRKKRTPTLFFPFTIFSMYIYEDSLSFFFYPISFCSGINTKTVEKNTRNWKGKAGAFETYSYRKWDNKRPGALKIQTDSKPHENEVKIRRPSGALIVRTGPWEQLAPLGRLFFDDR